MIPKLIKFFIIFLILQSSVYAQLTNNVSVVTRDKDDKPFANASVSIWSLPDSLVIQTSYSSSSGVVNFSKIKNGRYIVIGSAVGFKKITSKVVNVGTQAGSDTIILQMLPAENLLSEVKVVSRKPLIENKIDRTIVNVDAFLNNAGNTLLDALSIAPNVDIDLNGNVSVKGKSGVVILIDGKRNFLSGIDLANYLRSIPASLLEQIEIMTHPSAKYDASGNAAVINIKLKKAKQMGFNTNISSNFNQGIYPKVMNSLIMNYKNSKWNLFGNVAYNRMKNFTHRIITRSIFNNPNSTNLLYVQDENDPVNFNDVSFSAGVDYLANKKWSVGLLYTHKNTSRVNSTQENGSFTDVDKGKAVSYMKGLNILSNPFTNNGIAMNIKNSIDKNRELSFDVNYELYNFRSHQELANTSYDDQGNLTTGSSPNPFYQKSERPSDIDIFSIKSDYTYNHMNLKLETGLKSSYIKSNNVSNYYLKINDTFKIDPNQSNHYQYQENINSGYVNLHYQFKKWELQGGLRIEQTMSTGMVENENKNFKNSYVQLFPTVYAGYAIDKNNTMNFTYGRRIDRPFYMDLNPFVYIIDPYTYNQGNPHLSPYFTNSIEVSYNYKQKLNIDASYSVTKNIIDDILLQNDTTKMLLQTRSNLNRLENIDVSVNYNTGMGKWGNLIVSDNIFTNHFSSNVLGRDLNRNVVTNLFNVTQQFHFNKGWNAELNIIYRTHLLFSAWNYRGPKNQNSFTIGKDILKHKGNLKLKVNDPFNVEKGWGSNDFGNVHTTIAYKEDSRRMGLTFTYRFQKGLKSSFKKMYRPEENKRIQ